MRIGWRLEDPKLFINKQNQMKNGFAEEIHLWRGIRDVGIPLFHSKDWCKRSYRQSQSPTKHAVLEVDLRCNLLFLLLFSEWWQFFSNQYSWFLGVTCSHQLHHWPVRHCQYVIYENLPNLITSILSVTFVIRKNTHDDKLFCRCDGARWRPR